VFSSVPAQFITLLVFVVGAFTLVLPSGYSFGFYFLCFTGLGVWLRDRQGLVPDEAKYFLWPLLVYAIGQGAMALHEKWMLRQLGNVLPFLLVPFGVWGIRKCKPNDTWFWAGLAVGALGAAAFAGYQSVVLGLRAGGHTHPIQFGNIALLLGVLCLVRAMVVFEWSKLNALLWLGFIAGLAASVWSQTRGGWVAVVLIFVWILAKATQGWGLVQKGVVVLVLAGLLGAPALQSSGVVQSRIKEAATEFNAFFEHGKQDTSVGARLAMWKIGLSGIANAPFFGHGDQGWLGQRDAAIANGELSSFSAGFTHLHNEYLNVTFKRGLAGLALYLALYLVPMLLFFKPYLNDARNKVRSLAIAGMVIPMMFMDFGLTQTFLSHNSGRVVLCSLWMCVAALLLNAKEDEQYD
jgi:O-antigen ligase